MVQINKSLSNLVCEFYTTPKTFFGPIARWRGLAINQTATT